MQQAEDHGGGQHRERGEKYGAIERMLRERALWGCWQRIGRSDRVGAPAWRLPRSRSNRAERSTGPSVRSPEPIFEGVTSITRGILTATAAFALLAPGQAMALQTPDGAPANEPPPTTAPPPGEEAP